MNINTMTSDRQHFRQHSRQMELQLKTRTSQQKQIPSQQRTLQKEVIN
jgi:hypothetical protein